MTTDWQNDLNTLTKLAERARQLVPNNTSTVPLATSLEYHYGKDKYEWWVYLEFKDKNCSHCGGLDEWGISASGETYGEAIRAAGYALNNHKFFQAQARKADEEFGIREVS